MTTLCPKSMIQLEKNSKEVFFRMNIALCDDNRDFLRSFRDVLQTYCAQKDWICQISSFQRGKALEEADLTGYHVLFLDIDLPDISGLELGSIIHNRYPDLLIVFLTAFPQYAPAGYKVRAFRYLIKDRMQDGDLQECLDDIWNEIYASNETIEVNDIERTRLCFRLRDIIYLSGTPQRHTFFHLITANGESQIECIGKITEYEEKLENHGFIRIHKSYMVNMFHINQIVNYYAYLSSGEQLKVSPKNYSEICRRYLFWRSHTP